uniref:Uncharacterized protein n=1 Tax=Rhizophora mucronata TaxID=61149 RepID=A0A2P2QA78_RHIMU
MEIRQYGKGNNKIITHKVRILELKDGK